MGNENGLEILTEKIPRDGMSKECQESLPFIAKQYFNKKPAKQLEAELSKKHKEFVEIITYNRLDKMLDQIIIDALKKPCGYSGRHLLEIKDNPALVADMIIKHCILYNLLKTELLEISKRAGITDEFWNRRYSKGKELETDRKALASLGSSLDFYVFMVDLSNRESY